MNIEASTKISTTKTTQSEKLNSSQKQGESSFAEELNTLSQETKTEEKIQEPEQTDKKENQEEAEDIDNVIDGLKNTVEEINKLQSQNRKSDNFNQADENLENGIKDSGFSDDKDLKNEDDNLINNDMNINEPQKEPKMPQMNAGMNFNSQNQAFSEFIQNKTEEKLKASEADLEEEKAILSTMDENIAIANRNMLLGKDNQNQTSESQLKTVMNNEGVKKVDTKSRITVETVVSYDNVIMSKDDVEFFTQLVENGAVEMNSQSAFKASKVSKSLADLIAKSMQDNKPVRIDFDNNISVIIKIGKDGKISADFLPSSQVAEAYLKENLPLLRQRFDDNNIDYDSLNQRKQKQEDKNNQKKERKHE